jgi:hypothetical protein
MTVLPGDVVLGKVDGVIVIPPHMAETVCVTSEIVRVRDIFGKLRLSQGRYLPGEIDGRWADYVEKDFLTWLAEGHAELPVPAETIAGYLQGRTW